VKCEEDDYRVFVRIARAITRRYYGLAADVERQWIVGRLAKEEEARKKAEEARRAAEETLRHAEEARRQEERTRGFSHFDFRKLVGQCLEEVGSVARERGIEIDSRSLVDRVMFDGDRNRLLSVLKQMVLRAIARTKADGEGKTPAPVRVFLKRSREGFAFGAEAVGEHFDAEERRRFFAREALPPRGGAPAMGPEAHAGHAEGRGPHGDTAMAMGHGELRRADAEISMAHAGAPEETGSPAETGLPAESGSPEVTALPEEKGALVESEASAEVSGEAPAGALAGGSPQAAPEPSTQASAEAAAEATAGATAGATAEPSVGSTGETSVAGAGPSRGASPPQARDRRRRGPPRPTLDEPGPVRELLAVARRHSGRFRVDSERLHRSVVDPRSWVGRTAFVLELPASAREGAEEAPPPHSAQPGA
jgi:hypothetical protein